MQKALESVAERIEQELLRKFEQIDTIDVGSVRLLNAMKYSTIGNAKRVRSFIITESAKIFGANENSAIDLACAIECIHAYSLVHDDLPALDNADTRRDKPSCHKEFDYETAILAGNSLMTLGFDIITNMDVHPNIKIALIAKLCKTIGCQGMMAGQMMDMMLVKDKSNTQTDFTHMNKLKTGELFSFCAEAGPILAITNQKNHEIMRDFGYDYGAIFQITDDILDVLEDSTSTKDTFINQAGGIENAKCQVLSMKDRALFRLSSFGVLATDLAELVKYTVSRAV